MTTLPKQTKAEPTIYRPLLIAADLDGDSRLLYGEAVETLAPPHQPSATKTLTATGPTGDITITVRRASIAEPDLSVLLEGLSGGSVAHTAGTLKVGPLVQRPRVLVIAGHAANPDAGSSLRPCDRFTYQLDEWWDNSESTLDTLWETRAFVEVGELIAQETGLQLHATSDRIGNFLRFNLLSRWKLDTQTSLDADDRWVRPIYAGADPGTSLQIQFRFSQGNETVTEQLMPLERRGLRVPTHSDYSTVSFSLFDRATGELLARDYGELINSARVSIGASATATVTDSHGTPHHVVWDGPPNGTQLFDIDAETPWNERARRRAVRNRRLGEHGSTYLFDKGQRSTVLDLLRELIANQTAEFLYIWDPYLNGEAVLDVLNWLRPGIVGGRLETRKFVTDRFSAWRSSSFGGPSWRSGPLACDRSRPRWR